MSPIVNYIYGPDNLQMMTDEISKEDIVVITLTITEGGYFIRKDTGQFDIMNAQIMEEI